MKAASQFVSRDFIRALTPEELRARMLSIQFQLGGELAFDIIFDGKEWFAWFYRDFRDVLIREAVDGNVQSKRR